MISRVDALPFGLLAAHAEEDLQWWFPWLAMGIGVICILTGINQIRTRRASHHRAATRMVMHWFGKKEMTGRWAVSTGYANVAAGVGFIIIGQ